MAQDGPRWPEDGPKMEPRWSQDGAKKLQNRRLAWARCEFCKVDYAQPFSEVIHLKWRKMDVRWPRDGPKMAQDTPKMPKMAQDGPKIAPKWPQDGPKTTTRKPQNWRLV